MSAARSSGGSCSQRLNGDKIGAFEAEALKELWSERVHRE
jgi:hypothetical protein